MKLYQTAPVTTVDPVDVVPLSSVAAALRMQLLGRGANGCQWHQGSVVSLSAPPKIGWGTQRIEGRYYDRDEDLERTPKNDIQIYLNTFSNLQLRFVQA